MPYIPPRRAISTATTIQVNSSSPAWLPDKGSWSTTLLGAKPASLNDANDIRGNFSPKFPSTRNWGGANGLFADFSGAVWNPHLGTYGGMMFHGGGHATSQGMLDNGVYVWLADDRSWRRLTDPGPYPGDLIEYGTGNDEKYWGIASYPVPGDDFSTANEPLKTYGEVKTNVPASNHSRWLPCILPPGNGGGSQGSFILTNVTAGHNTGAGVSGQMHALNCASALSFGSVNAYQAWSRLGPIRDGNRRAWAACVDTYNGYIYASNAGFPSSYELNRYNIATGTWTTANPTGWNSSSDAAYPIVYAATHHIMVVLRDDFTVRVINADASPMTISTATVSGSPPSGGAPAVGTGGGLTWCPDLGIYGAFVHYNYVTHEVKACYAPANPLSGGSWTWATLTANNTPSGRGDAVHWYNRFQYAPALKSFFLCSMPGDAYGGILCFRPLEIA